MNDENYIKELRTPGKVITISGTTVDLLNYGADDVDVYDIAWGLGRTLRYGGHMREDYTVAHHAVIMSYLVDEEYALEALHHDSAEALIGDIIWPVKALFPEVGALEDKLLGTIMRSFKVPSAEYDKGGYYTKNDVIRAADRRMLEHECFSIGIRPGIYIPAVEDAWLKAAKIHEQYWYAAQYVFLQRHFELMGEEDPHNLDLATIGKLWFPKQYVTDEETPDDQD